MTKPHVLSVEDQKGFQEALSFRLEGREDEVEVVEDGQSADLCLGIHSFNIVLLLLSRTSAKDKVFG